MNRQTVAVAQCFDERALLMESLEDLREDFAELAWISASTSSRLERGLQEILDARPHLRRVTLQTLADDIRHLRRRFGALRDNALGLRQLAATIRPTGESVIRLTEGRAEIADLVRTLIASAAAAITGADWQSPSFAHSLFAQAGRFAGRVTEHLDDYRRDRHADAARFEETYLREYVDRPAGMDLRALMTNCGMSAFATVLAHLAAEEPSQAGTVAGRSLYHECRGLLARSPLGTRLVEVDEDDTDTLLQAIDDTSPSTIFLDALCNERAMAMPDLPSVIGHLASRSKATTLVVDATGLSCSVQPFDLLPNGVEHVRIIVVESLTKYPQFGLDRTPAGMIVAPRADAAHLDAHREHLGTNVPDAAPFLIPGPNRPALTRRLARIGRNAIELATALSEQPSRTTGVVLGARHPALPDHPAWDRARQAPFAGGYVAVRFSPEADCPEIHGRFVRAVLETASERSVPVVAGASFGFDVTRVYRTASDPAHGWPFVRIAAGTEHRMGLERLKAVLSEAAGRL